MIAQLFASFLVLAGIYLYGRMSVWAPAISALGCLLWAIIALVEGLYGMLALNLFLGAMHCYNLLKWTPDDDGSSW